MNILGLDPIINMEQISPCTILMWNSYEHCILGTKDSKMCSMGPVPPNLRRGSDSKSCQQIWSQAGGYLKMIYWNHSH